MPLFKTGECCICGKDVGVLGKIKIADGLLCSACSRKMSPFMTGKKKFSAAEVKEHLAYREENKKALASFHPDFESGNGMKVIADTKNGKFIVCDDDDWRKENPDLLTRIMLRDAVVEVVKNENEVKKQLDDGTYESYEPKRYEYEYAFNMHMTVNHPWFKEIDFELSDPSARPTAEDDPAFRELAYMGKEIQHVLLPGRYPAPEAPAAEPAPKDGEWTCECGQVNNSNFCSACGKPRPVRWFCPDCGTENHGAFCVNCGRKKPI
jgi:hypothetical protein